MKSIKVFILLSIAFFCFDLQAQWINCNGPYGGSIFALENNSELVIAGTYNGIFVSTNNGLSWTQRNFGIPQIPITSLLVKGNTIFAGTETQLGVGGIYKSTDNAISWIPANNGLTVSAISRIFSIVASDSALYASAYGKGVYKSFDNGDNWFEINSGLTSTAVRNLAQSSGYIYCATEGGIYRSSNSGLGWVKLSNGLPTGAVFSIGAVGEFVYTSFFTNEIFRSTNYGLFWTDITGGLPAAIIPPYAFFGANKYNVFAGTYGNGIYHTSNFGVNWTAQSQGLPDSTTVSCFTIKDTTMFAGTIYGAFRRPVSQLVGIRQISSAVPGSFALEQNFPNPFNPKTVIRFSLSQTQNVTLKVYDILGKETASLINEKMLPGTYEYSFNAANLSSGIYFYKLTAGSFSQTKKMLLSK